MGNAGRYATQNFTWMAARQSSHSRVAAPVHSTSISLTITQTRDYELSQSQHYDGDQWLPAQGPQTVALATTQPKSRCLENIHLHQLESETPQLCSQPHLKKPISSPGAAPGLSSATSARTTTSNATSTYSTNTFERNINSSIFE